MIYKDNFLKKVVECITGKESSLTVYEGMENPGVPFQKFTGDDTVEEGALWELLGAIQEYAEGHYGKIHWRWPPMIESQPDGSFYASARLVICT